jgi:hypothetical protein
MWMFSVYLFLLRLNVYDERKAKEDSGIFMVRYASSSQFYVTAGKTVRRECFARRQKA